MVSQIIGLNKKANPHPFDFPLIYFWNAGCADIEIIKITLGFQVTEWYILFDVW